MFWRDSLENNGKLHFIRRAFVHCNTPFFVLSTSIAAARDFSEISREIKTQIAFRSIHFENCRNGQSPRYIISKYDNTETVKYQ